MRKFRCSYPGKLFDPGRRSLWAEGISGCGFGVTTRRGLDWELRPWGAGTWLWGGTPPCMAPVEGLVEWVWPEL